ncbi:MAG: S1 family peptidase [Magnetospiraceae bacterium]
MIHPLYLKQRARNVALAMTLLGSVSLVMSVSSAMAADNVKGLPPAPTWKDGGIERGTDGRIKLNPHKKDPLATIKRGKRLRSHGSGFFISAQGHIATNRHVVDDCATITVEDTRGNSAPATLSSTHSAMDLALLSAEITPKAWAVFDPRGPRERGEDLKATGYPTRTLAPLTPQVTKLDFIEMARNQRQYLFKGDVYPGNSGGPILNRVGHVVGIVTATINKPEVYRQTGKRIDGMGLAISSLSAYRFYAQTDAAPTAKGDVATPTTDTTGTSGTAIVTKISCWK